MFAGVGTPLFAVEWMQTPMSFPAMVQLIRDAEIIARLVESLDDSEAISLAVPNVILQFDEGALVGWYLERPVLRGARAREEPMKAFSRTQEGYADMLNASPPMAFGLAANPNHRGIECLPGRIEPYTLEELGSRLPGGWRRSSIPSTPAAREYALMRWGAREIGRPRTRRRLWALGAALRSREWLKQVRQENIRRYGTAALDEDAAAAVAEFNQRLLERSTPEADEEWFSERQAKRRHLRMAKEREESSTAWYGTWTAPASREFWLRRSPPGNGRYDERGEERDDPQKP